MKRDSFTISTNPAKLDIAVIHSYLARSYWAEGIPRETVERAVRNSFCFGLYDEEVQVGFARVVTDRATFGYLCDVFILESHQGKGLGKWLMEVIMNHPELQGFRRWMLATRDAHGLYKQVGFEPLSDPNRYMQIARPKIYLQKPE